MYDRTCNGCLSDNCHLGNSDLHCNMDSFSWQDRIHCSNIRWNRRAAAAYLVQLGNVHFPRSSGFHSIQSRDRMDRVCCHYSFGQDSNELMDCTSNADFRDTYHL